MCAQTKFKDHVIRQLFPSVIYPLSMWFLGPTLPRQILNLNDGCGAKIHWSSHDLLLVGAWQLVIFWPTHHFPVSCFAWSTRLFLSRNAMVEIRNMESDSSSTKMWDFCTCVNSIGSHSIIYTFALLLFQFALQETLNNVQNQLSYSGRHYMIV